MNKTEQEWKLYNRVTYLSTFSEQVYVSQEFPTNFQLISFIKLFLVLTTLLIFITHKRIHFRVHHNIEIWTLTQVDNDQILMKLQCQVTRSHFRGKLADWKFVTTRQVLTMVSEVIFNLWISLLFVVIINTISHKLFIKDHNFGNSISSFWNTCSMQWLALFRYENKLLA